MTLQMRYWVIITCDTCGKKLEFESQQMGADRVPMHWVQAAPPGEVMQREFCSVECVNNYVPPKKPWEEDTSATGT